MPDSSIIRSRAPLRISFGGGGTDVPPFVDERGGAVVNATITRYAYVTLVPNATREVRLRSLDLGDDVSFSLDDGDDEAFGMDLARGVVRRLGVPDRGFDLFTHTDCPPGSGLGSSSTMTVALVGAFDRWLGLGLTRYDIARLAHDIERDDLGIPRRPAGPLRCRLRGASTLSSSTATARSSTRSACRRRGRPSSSTRSCSPTPARSRLSSAIIEDQIRNFETGETDAVDAMVETRALADEMKRLLLTGEFRAFGETLHQAWLVKKRMSSRISTPLIDGLYTAARDAGALGGKIAGAGGGGFMFFFTDFDRRQSVEHALTTAGAEVVHFAFSDEGPPDLDPMTDTSTSTETLATWLTDQADEAATVTRGIRDAIPELLALAGAMAATLRNGGSVYFFGNGGSAADAQHWAAELSGRFFFDRPPLAGHALTVNTSAITAIGNDYGFEQVFSRQLAGAGRTGDMAVGISTSGQSPNVLRAFETARERGIRTVGFCGAARDAFDRLCDHVVSSPSANTARIQEGHELAAHLVFSAVERDLFGSGAA